MSFFTKIRNIATGGLAKPLLKNMFGGDNDSSGNNGEAEGVLNENIQGAKNAAGELKALGVKEAGSAQELKDMLMQGMRQNQQNVQPMLDSANKQFDSARENQNSYLASIGYRPDTNNVFNKAGAELEGQRVSTLTGIQNQANQQQFNNLLNGLGMGRGLNSDIYGGQRQGILGGQQLIQGALNAKTAYLSNRDMAKAQEQANDSGNLLGLIGTLGGAFLGGPVGATAGNFLGGMFKGSKGNSSNFLQSARSMANAG